MKEEFDKMLASIKEIEFDEGEWYCAYDSEKLSVIEDVFSEEFGEEILNSKEYKNWIINQDLREF